MIADSTSNLSSIPSSQWKKQGAHPAVRLLVCICIAKTRAIKICKCSSQAAKGMLSLQAARPQKQGEGIQLRNASLIFMSQAQYTLNGTVLISNHKEDHQLNLELL